MNKKKKFLLLCASKKSDLSAGYTALEYLESSGTQYLRLPDLNVTSEDSVKLDFSVAAYSGSSADGVFSAYNYDSGELLRAYTANVSGNLRLALRWGTWPGVSLGISLAQNLSLLLSESTAEVNGTQIGIPQANTFSYTDFVLFTQRVQNKFWNSLIKLFSFSVPGKCRLIPALRDSDGVPGMWDTVSKTFYTNAGTGVFGYRVKGAPAAFSLRDPHRVAPSGVYARKVSETELEIVADTEETSGDGWEWFANTGEAHEHFGIITSEQIQQ